ncbi:hypothetical protein [Streptomyces qinglanensis]|uniref:Uncharacterized protein n=1 Tax=Streptomyces qinglanensis TaxID=943816 RepID=A0A1H9U3S9_9ACTN|nr:hypothetical protein [Streptomyces qinglanensis]SES04039.1 hypothetical protein SAMN05421870_107297 [Streptomyces qinglanensis]
MTAVPNEPFLSVAVRCFVVGAVGTAVVNAVWWLMAGGPMPPWASLVTSMVVMAAAGRVAAYRRERAWRRVIAAYELPSFGADGGDTPGRPPAV